MSINTNSQTKILIIDDEAANLQVLKQILSSDYKLFFAKDGYKGIELAKSEKPNIILLDVMMPGMTGHEVCKILRTEPSTSRIPVIFVTAMADEEDEADGFTAGAVDYITKPISPAIVKARVKTHLSLVRNEELRETRLQIIQRLGLAAEYKDNETGLHVIRMSHYSRIIALASGFSPDCAEDLLHASPMHDIGKIGIPDHILQKQGKLTPEEWAVMQKHPAIGAEIIGDHDSRLLQLAKTIAQNHHEKWDGSGYPNSLKGDEIPVEARIVALADVFDALTTKRPYKKAWEISDAIEYIRKESGKHFDPNLIPVFLDVMPKLLEVKERWAES
ncbi:two-component system response regulator [Leptospira kmetyi]|uniref:Two-component system response regulator n=1 Tax=Leptospira kmetyi TaxID=408139 RepID=A0A2M9XRC3_9LEPT|nr:HD domain-containing phosphohydrolase [Leptospira kmetyi]AYV57937.1 two-component system response regulator [Leptospira kmetyi]EQA55761.1 response regulator receiver domain protein [Leptospira kmetyi serovar Malaysia str. Bejo-Iso9]PJZ41850.1 two-component system response regulator [Leptospira kmetyi]TGK14934.1 two-component system response regulator [Leptospira kmetyi]TGK33451.1 two-component system response regulator [Leptospira kmetyi]